jgi:hypothetical protein
MTVFSVSAPVQHCAPCGAALTTGRRPLRGAALFGTVARQVREHLQQWGIPLERYDCRVERNAEEVIAGVFGALIDDTLTVTFTHRETDAEIVVTEIWVDDSGEIVQLGSNSGALAF